MPRIAPLMLLAMLAGCARETVDYPSLATRPAEARGFAEPTAPVAVATPDPALDTRLNALAGRIDAVAKGFDGDAADAGQKARAARGAAVGSYVWLDAQQALAALDGWRAQASGIVSDIDALGAERAQALAAPYPALGSLRARAQAEADREATMISQLQATIPAP